MHSLHLNKCSASHEGRDVVYRVARPAAAVAAAFLLISSYLDIMSDKEYRQRPLRLVPPRRRDAPSWGWREHITDAMLQ